MNIEVEEVEQEDKKYIKGAKRQKIPFKVNWDCPGCRSENYYDYRKGKWRNTFKRLWYKFLSKLTRQSDTE